MESNHMESSKDVLMAIDEHYTKYVNFCRRLRIKPAKQGIFESVVSKIWHPPVN